MRRSFSWDRAFFTSDGFLDDEELSSMIEGSGDDVKHELQKIEEIKSLEAKLFEEIEASTQKSTGTSNVTNSSINLSSGKRESQAKKVIGAGGPPGAAPTTLIKKVQPTRSSPLSGGSGGSPGNKIKSPATLARRSTSSRTSKSTADSPSKTPPGITTKNKVAPINTRISRTSPASPISQGTSGSSSSTFAVNRRSKRGSSVPRRSSVNNEKPSAINLRRNDDRKTSKPTVGLIPKTQSSISLKNKPPPLDSHPSSPLGLSNSSPSTSSSTTCTVDQRSKSTLTNDPTGQIPDRNGKQSAVFRPQTASISRPSVQSMARGIPSPKGKSSKSRLLVGLPKTGATQHSKTGSPNCSKTRKLPALKTVAAVNTGLKPNSWKTTTPKPSKKQSSDRESILIVSPEVLDIKGKLNALKMEISMQKKDRCNKMVRAESGKGDSSSTVGIIQMKNQTKST